MTSEDLDLLEDLEARLYGQVYHANSEDSDLPIKNTSASPVVSSLSIDVPISVPLNIVAPQVAQKSVNTRANTKKSKTRYYQSLIGKNDTKVTQELEKSNNEEAQVQTSNDPKGVVEKQSTTTTVSTSNPACLNNITVNQYTYSPLVVNPTSSTESYESFGHWLRESQESQKKSQPNRRRSKRKRKVPQRLVEKLAQEAKSKRPVRAQNSVVIVSDESDCEVEIVSTQNTDKEKLTRKSANASVQNIDDSSDDDDPDAIVYIEPPPVPLVTIDSDEESSKDSSKDKSGNSAIQTPEKQQSKTSDELLGTPESTNDFLDQSGLESNYHHRFNFGLHGTDFSQTSNEFVRPANPDPAETESSCSTSDCPRDFNNSLKTGVFGEVEFPKDDLFSEQNLENFGTFITPKRTPVKRAGSSTPKKNVKAVKKSKAPDESEKNISEESSDSESDFDGEENSVSGKKLPTLSAIETETVTSTPVSKSSHNTKNSAKKKKKKQSKAKELLPENNENETAKDSSVISAENEAESFEGETSFKSDSDKQKMKLIDSDTKRKRKRIRSRKKVARESTSKSDNQVNTNTDHVEENNTTSISTQNENNPETGEIEQPEQSVDQPLSQNNLNNPCTEVTLPESIADVTVITSNNTVEKRNRNRRKSSRSNTTEPQSDTVIIVDGTENDISSTTVEIGTRSPNVEIIENICIPQFDTFNQANMQYVELDTTAETTLDEFVSEYALDSVNTNINVDEMLGAHNATPPIIDPQSSSDIVASNVSENSEEEFIVVDEVVDVEEDDIIDMEMGPDSDIEMNMVLANAMNIDITQSSNTQDSLVNEGDDQFNIETIWKRMSDDPEKWKISPKDRLGPLCDLTRGKKCKRCREAGHLTQNCPNKPGPPNCSLCGNPGHREPRCPNRVCFQCGNPGKYSTPFCYKCAKHRNTTCSICKTLGHTVESCPDAWRRYHLTTEPGPIQMLNGPQLKPRNEQWCSGCAQQGHLEHECNSFLYHREYPSVAPYIHDYQDLYARNAPSGQKINPAYFSRNSMSVAEPIVNIDVLPGAVQLNENIPEIPHIPVIPPLLGESSGQSSSTSVINPFSILPAQNNLNKKFVDHRKRKSNRVFKFGSLLQVRNHIKKSISHLNNLNISARDLKGKLAGIRRKIANFTDKHKVEKEINEFNRQMNMFLFGKCQIWQGKRYMSELESFLGCSSTYLVPKKRKAIETAYNYIFGSDLPSEVHDIDGYYKPLAKFLALERKRH